ncbi:hypothetical protein ACSBR2_013674 [Camellia fascicularis]
MDLSQKAEKAMILISLGFLFYHHLSSPCGKYYIKVYLQLYNKIKTLLTLKLFFTCQK